jgi:uncharacterized repeat protein (TIGR03803 family)
VFRLSVLIAAIALSAATIAPAATLKTLYEFDGKNGDGPGGLIFDQSGNLYGTTSLGGSTLCSFGCGTVFMITP